ncbi:aspartate/glutamate racemase family protein [Aestuariirhabdus sp. Z084]|uniref:aspartate/glutamate racemase family protein n=1 Tax=Aestuariirhabdus haliotis TaxID=2918751 RepID=UPI00201B3C64|nr:aspartate/glutamate racemase family protein [Aestuariirhabdus haliotis]MCL6416439.1 aspartate/glutamate racemase family protein [Aestuariirhabdus haliotis]MCL6420394.1 aspartate/glutamate racemase family protein [Aestuariirhabdus haliotis]
MKRLGIIGGMSWESTQSYYRLLNQGVKAQLGGLHSADLLLHSVDFSPIAELQAQGAWETLGQQLCESASLLQAAGAAGVLIATNTMHRVADQVEQVLDVPLLHIADATGQALQEAGIQRVGLLGTAFTMEQQFYRGRLEQRFGLEVLVPQENDRALVHRVIYDELCQGVMNDGSRQQYQQVIGGLQEVGAEAIILGCTEIGLLIKSGDVDLPLFDTTAIHCQQAVEFMLAS